MAAVERQLRSRGTACLRLNLYVLQTFNLFTFVATRNIVGRGSIQLNRRACISFLFAIVLAWFLQSRTIKKMEPATTAQL